MRKVQTRQREICDWLQQVGNVLLCVADCCFTNQQTKFVLDPDNDWKPVQFFYLRGITWLPGSVSSTILAAALISRYSVVIDRLVRMSLQ